MIPCYLRKELNILFSIVKKKETSLKELANSLDISKRVVKDNLNKINHAFAEIFSMSDFIVSNQAGVICINLNYKQHAVEYAYQLKLNLLQKNLLFNYCVQLVTHSKISKEELLKTLYISDQYLAKLTQQLNDFFKEYNLTIVASHGTYQLQGEELTIRIFSYIFLQDAFQELEWPFSHVDQASIEKNVNIEELPPSPQPFKPYKRALLILYAILQLRISNHQLLTKPPTHELLAFLELIRSYSDMTLVFNQEVFKNLSPEEQTLEQLYFNFLARIFLPFIVSQKQKKELGQLFFQSAHPYCITAKKILQQAAPLLMQWQSKDTLFFYLYYLTIFEAWYSLVGNNYTKYLKLYLPEPSFHKPVNNAYFDAIQTSVANIIKPMDHIVFISCLLYTLTVSEKKPCLTIYLQIIKDFSADYFIKNRLSALYNQQAICIIDDEAAADLIVTDTYEKALSNKTIFYLDSIENEESWYELTELIQQMYREKLRSTTL
ncbi:helix-turn-helix domain-containing protein [Enterococcus faecalis]